MSTGLGVDDIRTGNRAWRIGEQPAVGHIMMYDPNEGNKSRPGRG